MINPDQHVYWQQTLSEWQASGLSGAAYCKQLSLSYHRFVYWRRKLNGRADRNKSQAQSGFVRVDPVSKDWSTDGLTVSLPGGISITGLHAGNIELLGALLRQL